MAIEERNTSAGLADAGAAGEDGAEPSARSLMSLDDLRLRLDSPLFAREPGLAAAAPMPHLRELTWEHVINPTSSQPVVPADPTADGQPSRPAPIRVEELMARHEPVLAPLPERADAPAPAANPATPAPLPTTAPPPLPTASTIPAATTQTPPVTSSTPVTGLPSFAAMLSSEVATVPSWSSDRLDVDDFVKPIEEPPPVARDTDPEVNDLAALILRSTPTGATPAVAEPPIAVPAPAVTAPPPPPLAVAPPAPVYVPEPEPAVVDITHSGEVPHPPVHSMMSPPLVRDTGVTPVVSGSPVQAELNRLAYVPDLDEAPDGPVEVPEIAYSDLRGAAPVAEPMALAGAPQLSQNELFQPRQVAQVHRHTYSDLVAQAAPMPRKRKRHVFRKFVTTVVLLGMVAGGLFAVKHYLLDRVNWPGDIAPLARAVEGERGLHFTKDLPVTTLSTADYALKLSDALGGMTDATAPQKAAMWRSLGLSTGTLNLGATGLAAAVDQPAFYDPASAQIYVLAGMAPELRTFALHRALTMALLDQQFKWSGQLTQAAPSVVLGTRAIFDADALAVAFRLLPDHDRTLLPDQQKALPFKRSEVADPTPFATDTMSRIGLPLWPYLASLGPDERNALEQTGVMSDSHALDLRRLVSGATDTVGTTTQGMLFWYHALASRVDDDLAWRTALGWRGDEVRLDTTGTTMCVIGSVTIDAPSANGALFAFTAWAASAPPQSATTMTPTTAADGQMTFAIRACDPGDAVPTNDGTPTLAFGGAPLRVEQYVELVTAKRSMAAAQAACVVYGDDVVTLDDERALFDPPTGWLAPSKHPAPDPAKPTCASLAGATPPAATQANSGGATAPAGAAPSTAP